jgi:hypothetical protein
MKQRPRIYYTETDKALMWDRWQKGESLQAITKCHSSQGQMFNRLFYRIPLRCRPLVGDHTERVI